MLRAEQVPPQCPARRVPRDPDFNTGLLHSAHGEHTTVEQDWEEPAMKQGVIWS